MSIKNIYQRPHNFIEHNDPKFVSNQIQCERDTAHNTLTVVSYNIEKGKNVIEAINLIASDCTLLEADVFLLQEMDEKGTEIIAKALGLNYIYFPINSNYTLTKHFGNSILTKDSIFEEHKLLLPHGQIHNNRFRGVTFANIKVNDTKILLGSAHLSTVFMPTTERKQQVKRMATHLVDSLHLDVPSIVGGDFNALRTNYKQYIQNQMKTAGYHISTEGLGTTHAGKIPFLKPEFDVIFARNLKLLDKGKLINDTVSDHYPIWAKFELSE